jgi:hypothetical protein
LDEYIIECLAFEENNIGFDKTFKGFDEYIMTGCKKSGGIGTKHKKEQNKW